MPARFGSSQIGCKDETGFCPAAEIHVAGYFWRTQSTIVGKTQPQQSLPHFKKVILVNDEIF